MKTIDNGQDELAVRRIVNVPKRGIGAATLNRVQDYSMAYGISYYDALLRADEIPGIGRGASKILPFTVLIQTMRTKLEYASLTELMEEVLEKQVTGRNWRPRIQRNPRQGWKILMSLSIKLQPMRNPRSILP